MKKIISLILAAMLLCAFAAVAEEEGPQTYEWSKYQSMAELMGAEGNWATYDQFNLTMWIPAEFVQTPDEDMPEDFKSQGYIDLFGSNDYELAIGVQHAFYDESIDTVEDLANGITQIGSYFTKG